VPLLPSSEDSVFIKLSTQAISGDRCFTCVHSYYSLYDNRCRVAILFKILRLAYIMESYHTSDFCFNLNHVLRYGGIVKRSRQQSTLSTKFPSISTAVISLLWPRSILQNGGFYTACWSYIGARSCHCAVCILRTSYSYN
jgi:hypothetical protein